MVVTIAMFVMMTAGNRGYPLCGFDNLELNFPHGVDGVFNPWFHSQPVAQEQVGFRQVRQISGRRFPVVGFGSRTNQTVNLDFLPADFLREIVQWIKARVYDRTTVGRFVGTGSTADNGDQNGENEGETYVHGSSEEME